MARIREEGIRNLVYPSTVSHVWAFSLSLSQVMDASPTVVQLNFLYYLAVKSVIRL